jgi:hypothetical protein
LLTTTARRDSTNATEAFDLGLLTAAEQQRRNRALSRAPRAAAKAI